MYWSAVADLYACSDEDGDVSRQGSLTQATTGVSTLGIIYDCSNFQAALGDANAHADAVVLQTEHTGNLR